MSFYVARLGVKRRADIAAQRQLQTPESLLAHAQFRKCLEVLDGDTSPKALYLRLRAMLYLGQHHDVVRAYFLDAVQALPAPDRGRAMGLIGTAYFRSGMRPAAEGAFREAYRLVSNEPDAIAEVNYYEALLRWSAHEFDRAETLINGLLSLQDWRAKALDLRSWIRCARGDYRGQLTDLMDAYAAVHGEDVWEKASILRAASALARELYDEHAASVIATAAHKLAWSQETAEHEFYTFRNLAWCYALGGASLASYDCLVRAEAAVPSSPHMVLIDADRAMIARYAGEKNTAERFLRDARYAASHADWKQNGESRTALLVLAQILAQEQPEAAWQYVEEYTKIRSSISPILAFGNRDLRLEALEQYTAGVVYRFSGKRDLARKSLKRALSIWRDAGYYWRAALAAFHLGEIDRPHYIDLARKLIDEHVPHAFFTDILAAHRRHMEHPDVLALSPSRREVLMCFIMGLSNKEIADRLGVQVQTVKNNLRYVFRYFGAHSARDLWPELRRRGIG